MRSRAEIARPFSLAVTRIERLVVCDIADDPRYTALEVQVFDDEEHGRGVAVLLGRKDGLVDVYRQPGLRLDRDGYRIGAGLGEWTEAEIDPARLEIAPDGAVIDVALTATAGRRIMLAMDDRDGRPRRRGDLLAPMGASIEAPVSLMLVYMRGFDFMRTSGRTPRLSIDGHPRKVASFPGPQALHRRHFVRYAESPLVVTLNREHDGPMECTTLLESPTVVRAGAGTHTAALTVHPSCPDVMGLAPGDRCGGSWELEVGGVARLVAGTWTARGTRGGAELSLVVTKGWQPRGLPPLYRFVTSVAKVFRSWPTTYRWSATVTHTAAVPILRSRWERTGGVRRR